MERIVYLDNAATTPVDSAVLDEMKPFFIEQFANRMTYMHSSASAAGRKWVRSTGIGCGISRTGGM